MYKFIYYIFTLLPEIDGEAGTGLNGKGAGVDIGDTGTVVRLRMSTAPGGAGGSRSVRIPA